MPSSTGGLEERPTPADSVAAEGSKPHSEGLCAHLLCGARLAAPSIELAVAVAAIVAASSSTAWGWTTVTNTNGDTWNVNDALVPGVDTGSIHNTGTNSLQGYGGIRMKVPGGARLNGILLRGFGLTPDSATAFSSKAAVQIGGVAVKRSLLFNTTDSWARFLDSFTNTTGAPVTIEVAFGGQLGYNTGTNQSAIAADLERRRRAHAGRRLGVVLLAPRRAPARPRSTAPARRSPARSTASATSCATRSPSRCRATGDEANHPGFVNTLTIPAGETRSLAHFVVTGLSETRTPAGGGTVPAAGTQVAAVGTKAAALAAAPPLERPPGRPSPAASPTGPSPACGAAAAPALGTVVKDPSLGATTSSPYNVVGKSITQLKADMASGATNAQQIMRAYLDRIAAYDGGPLGLHSVITVAPDAMAQAKAADDARAAGDTRPLLGIPILAKDIFDTKDMPTTGGSLVFAGYRPTKDAWMVAKLREAGAIIMGKANLAEFATDGHFSPERLRAGVERVRPVEVARSAPPAARPSRSRRASPPPRSARRPATRCGGRRAPPRWSRCAAPTACRAPTA